MHKAGLMIAQSRKQMRKPSLEKMNLMNRNLEKVFISASISARRKKVIYNIWRDSYEGLCKQTVLMAQVQ